MFKLSIIAILLTLTSVLAQAQTASPIKKADLLCSNGGTTFVLSSELKKLWLVVGHGSSATSIELPVSEFGTFRCPSCYEVKAQVEGMEYKLVTEGDVEGHVKADFTTTYVHSGDRVGSEVLPCRRLVKKARGM